MITVKEIISAKLPNKITVLVLILYIEIKKKIGTKIFMKNYTRKM